jgi:hypothetical protein
MKLINSIQILALTILTSSLSFAQTSTSSPSTNPTATKSTSTTTPLVGGGSATTTTTTINTTTNPKTGNVLEVQKTAITNADGTVTKSSSKTITENNGTGSTIARSQKDQGGTATTTIGATGATAKKN